MSLPQGARGLSWGERWCWGEWPGGSRALGAQKEGSSGSSTRNLSPFHPKQESYPLTNEPGCAAGTQPRSCPPRPRAPHRPSRAQRTWGLPRGAALSLPSALRPSVPPALTGTWHKAMWGSPLSIPGKCQFPLLPALQNMENLGGELCPSCSGAISAPSRGIVGFPVHPWLPLSWPSKSVPVLPG